MTTRGWLLVLLATLSAWPFAPLALADDPPSYTFTPPSTDWTPIPTDELEDTVLAAWLWTDGTTRLQIAHEGGEANMLAWTVNLTDSRWEQTYATYLLGNFERTYKKFSLEHQRPTRIGRYQAQELICSFKGNRLRKKFTYHGFVVVPRKPHVYRIELLALKSSYNDSKGALLPLANSFVGAEEKPEEPAAEENLESCFELGVRFGRCATAVAAGRECDPADDIGEPERCLGETQFRLGIAEGRGSVPASEPEPEYETLYVQSSGLNVRSEPSTSADIVERLSQGARVEVIKDSDIERDGYTWVESERGYLAREFLSTTKPAPQSGARTIALGVFSEIGATRMTCPRSIVGPLRTAPDFIGATCASLARTSISAAQSRWDRAIAGRSNGFTSSRNWMDASALAPGTTMTVKWYHRGSRQMMVVIGSIPESPGTILVTVVESRK